MLDFRVCGFRVCGFFGVLRLGFGAGERDTQEAGEIDRATRTKRALCVCAALHVPGYRTRSGLKDRRISLSSLQMPDRIGVFYFPGIGKMKRSKRGIKKPETGE